MLESGSRQSIKIANLCTGLGIVFFIGTVPGTRLVLGDRPSLCSTCTNVHSLPWCSNQPAPPALGCWATQIRKKRARRCSMAAAAAVRGVAGWWHWLWWRGSSSLARAHILVAACRHSHLNCQYMHMDSPRFSTTTPKLIPRSPKHRSAASTSSSAPSRETLESR